MSTSKAVSLIAGDRKTVILRGQFWATHSGFDHGVGHSLLLLYYAKASNCQKSKEFKGLGHYPSNTALSVF